jgi:hypothetical protein
MPATPITPTVRFDEASVLRIYFVTTIANKSAPTRAELNAGSDLTAEVSAINGFSTSSDTLDAPDFGSRFVSQVPGAITAEDSSIEVYRSSTSSDIRSLLPRDTAGFIVVFPEGDTTGLKMDVYPVKVKTAAKPHDQNATAKHTISFAITSIPAENVTVP